MLGYTGTFEGAPISVQSTGMGCPSAGIVYEELIQLGATRLLRVGTCGAIGAGMAMADFVIGVTASAVDTTALQYAGMDGYAPAATFALAETAARLAPRGRRRVHTGPIVTSALFYDPDQQNIARWKRTGHLAIEMEAAMLYTVAAVHGVEALAMMTVSDLVTESSVDAHLRRRAAARRRRHDAPRLPRRRVLTRAPHLGKFRVKRRFGEGSCRRLTQIFPR